MTDLIEFLRARLTEDTEKVAAMQREQVRVKTAPIFQGHPLGWLDGVDIFVSPTRWRAEVDAKQKILSLYSLDFSDDGEPVFLGGYGEAYWDVVRELALPYADHPDYRPEWRP